MNLRALVPRSLFVAVLLLLPVCHAQKVFRDTTFSDGCETAQQELSDDDDIVITTTCAETAGYWFSVEVARLLGADNVKLNFNYAAGAEMDRVVMSAENVTMRYLGNVRSTFNQVFGTARFDITNRYTLETLQRPDAETGLANRKVAEWVRDDGVTVSVYAGVHPANPNVGVVVSVIFDAPNPDAWQF